jgi:formamidopyrimidine-DNA glycosylase
MLELPEALTIANQINNTIVGKRITNVTAAYTPHKFAWFYGDPKTYHALLTGKTIDKAAGYGGMVEIKADNAIILVGDGVGLRYHFENEQHPIKHQLLIEFEDFSSISASVQMYGGIWCFEDNKFENAYLKAAKEKPSPLSDKFNKSYYDSIISSPEVQKLSAKALLATEQRIPGLGNGILQDILFNAKVHPKKKVNTFTEIEKENIFNSIKATLAEMTLNGGRDTERDLFGCIGGYKIKVGKNTVDRPCPLCNSMIKKENYMGGSIYFCSGCQAV